MNEEELSKEAQDQLLKYEQGMIDESELSDEVKNLLNPTEEDFELDKQEKEEPVEEPKNDDGEKKSESDEGDLQDKNSKLKPKNSKKFYADKANKYEQSFNTLKRKLEEASKDPQSLKKLLSEYGQDVSDMDDDVDPLSDEALIKQQKSVSKMLAELKMEKVLRSERERIESAQKSETNLFAQIESLQEEYPELQTQMSVKDINEVALSYGGKNVSKEQFLEAGVSEKDYQAFTEIFKLNTIKSQQNLPDFETALLKSGKLKEIFNSRYNKKVSVDDLNKGSRTQRANELKNIPKEGARSSASSTHKEDGQMSDAYLSKIMQKADKYGYENLSVNEKEAFDTFMQS